MARKALLGNKVRRLRRDHDLTQVDLARRLGISASYLNLIEHNQRPLTLPLLLKLAENFDVDLQTFSHDGEARLRAEMTELLGDPLFRELDLAQEELNEIVTLSPALCRATLALYRAYRGVREDLQALGERLSDTAFLSTSTHELRTLLTTIRSFSEILQDHEDLDPERRRRFTGILVGESERLSAVVNRMLEFAAEEGAAGAAGGPPPAEAVSDFLQAHDNHFPALEEAAAALAEETGLPPLAGSRELAALLTERFDLTVSLVAEPPEAQDAAAGQDFRLWSGSPEGTRRFQLAKRLAHCAAAGRLDGVLESEPLAGAETAALCRDVLANYVAAALLMPYDEFLAAARALRYDIALLQQRFGTSFEQVCHRLTTLRRLGARGVPFHFLRVDIAGNLSKRFSASGLSIPRYGGLCPRWNAHAAFLAPGQIRRQVSRLPDDSTYFDIACTVVKAERGYHAPKSYFAIGLGCEISHARALVYSDGMDLETAEAAMPVGVTCRLCARDDCRQRAQAPILPSLQTA